MRRIAIALFTFGVSGCSSDAKTDKAAATSKWTVDAKPLLDIAGADSIETFTDVNGAARLSDGTVVVADGPASTFNYFAADGKYLKKVGGKGKGPSEFERLVGMLHCGDSLYARDLSGDVYKVFSADGALTRQFRVPTDTAKKSAISSACNQNGMFVNFAWERNDTLPAKSQVMRFQVPYWLSGPDGTWRASLGTHAGLERWFTKGQGGGGSFTVLPLGKRSVIAVGKSRAYIGTADSFAIDVYSLDGTRAETIRRAVAVQPVKSADIERYKLLDSTGRSVEVNASYVRRWSAMEFAKTLPAYTALLVDGDDNLWIRSQPRPPNTTVTWFVYSPAGKEIASAELPSAMTVYEIGHEYVLGAETNLETGVKQVKVLTLRRKP